MKLISLIAVAGLQRNLEKGSEAHELQYRHRGEVRKRLVSEEGSHHDVGIDCEDTVREKEDCEEHQADRVDCPAAKENPPVKVEEGQEQGYVQPREENRDGHHRVHALFGFLMRAESIKFISKSRGSQPSKG